jgi:hypothetical protein
VVAPRRSPRPPVYGPDVIAALTACWLVLGMPAGKRLAPMLNELVAVLRHFGELVIDDDTAELLASMSAATIDRRLAGERATDKQFLDHLLPFSSAPSPKTVSLTTDVRRAKLDFCFGLA